MRDLDSKAMNYRHEVERTRGKRREKERVNRNSSIDLRS